MASIMRAEDWPQWRGPNRDGVWTGKAFSFPREGLAVRWKASAGGGYSSPVVADGRAYVFDADLQRPRAWERLRCFNLKNGQLLWAQSNAVTYPDWAFTSNNPGGPNATCIVEDGNIYSIGANGDLFCRDVRQGKLIWGTNLTQSCGLRDYAAITPSPLIEGELLITVPGGDSKATVVAFNKKSGKEQWRALNDSWTYSSPIIITAGGKRQLIVWTQNGVRSLDPTSGNIFWREEIKSPGDMTISTPVFQEGHLLAGGLMFQLAPATTDHKILWPENRVPTKRIFSNTSTPLIRGDFVYTATIAGKLICLEAKTGRPVWETNSVTLPGNGSSMHLTTVDDSVLIFTDQGNLIQARLDGSGYKEIQRAQVIEPLYSFAGKKVAWVPPAFADGVALFRNDTEIKCVRLKSP